MFTYSNPDIKPSNSPLVLADLLPFVLSLLGHPVAPEVPEYNQKNENLKRKARECSPNQTLLTAIVHLKFSRG